MAGSLNKVILIGRLGADPKVSYTTNGTPVANFNIATDEGYKDSSGQRQERTEWHRIVVWSQQAEFCGNYLSKGSLICVEGRLQTRKWQAQDGSDRWTTEVVAQRIQGLDSRRQEGMQQPGEQQYQQRPQQQRPPQQQYRQQQPQQQGGYQNRPPEPPEEEDMGPAFPSEAGGMDDVPF